MDELTYDSEFIELAEHHADIVKFVPTVSRPAEIRNSNWKGATGRINIIAEELLAKFNLPKEDTRIYACGHPGMIEDMKKKLPSQGWNFIEERFWKE